MIATRPQRDARDSPLDGGATEGEFTKDVPPVPIGEFTKPRKTSTLTDAGEAGPSSVPDGSGDQDEEYYSSASDEDDEDDPRPRRGAGPRTLEEKLRGERAFIEELLDEDEHEDLLNTSVPREMWKAADFVEEDMVYACVDVLVMEAMRHLKTIEAKSTLKSYTSWINDFKRWAAKMLKKIGDKLPTAEQTRHVDEIGHCTHNNKSKDWDNEKVVKRKHIWLHGPRFTITRLRAYIKFMRREYKIDAETNAPVQAYMVHMIPGRIKACQMAARVEATLYKEKELGIMREISVVRSEMLWRFLLFKVLTLLSHHSLMRGASIRERTLPDIFLYRLASTSSVNPDNQPVVMVVAARNSKTSKDARLQQSYAARERSTVQNLDLEEKIENRDATIASLAAEITRLTEALRVSEARRMPEAPPAANDQSPSDGGSAESASRGEGANKPNKPPETVEEASYELNVVQPWRTATTVKDAWRLWTSCTSADTRRLCDRFREPGFIDRHTLLDGASQGAHGALNKIAAPGIGTFADALTVLNADAVATYAGQGKGVKGLGKTEVSKLHVVCAFVGRGFKLETWVADLFPDTWVEQMKKTLADLARENDAGQLPPTNKSTKRAKTA
ncbi:unnamed protein product [Closterium sp. NIES-64]|nr:unnamed protein product [Closterium sp. NIES-64]